uniref:Uncharacterized protein n=1 Tax=Molossus molossus TaxID=27622 RepID=A0A7J8I201_MOLMO|nr:hypothetical protein HJG59_010874 [Molossus molossus]
MKWVLDDSIYVSFSKDRVTLNRSVVARVRNEGGCNLGEYKSVWRMKELFCILTEVVVTQTCACVTCHRTVHQKCQFCCKLKNNISSISLVSIFILFKKEYENFVNVKKDLILCSDAGFQRTALRTSRRAFAARERLRRGVSRPDTHAPLVGLTSSCYSRT